MANRIIHYFNDLDFLFKTIMMYPKEERMGICDEMSVKNLWFGGRFLPSERGLYLAQREFIEDVMRERLTKLVGKLPEIVPTYFYLVAEFDQKTIAEGLDSRRQYRESTTQYFTLDPELFMNQRYISFTIDDSFRSFRTLLTDNGIALGDPDNKMTDLPDHGKLFPIKELKKICEKYKHIDGLKLEIQVWSSQLLEAIRKKVLDGDIIVRNG